MQFYSTNYTFFYLVGQESITLEGLQFDLTTIKAATNNFLNHNKIGKGGFGVVYKVRNSNKEAIYLSCFQLIHILIFISFLGYSL